MQEDYISHHGVLGQKWGVRNFQNPDGSLTDKGKAHYNKQLQKMAKYTSARQSAKVKATTADEKAKRYSYKATKANARPRLTEFHDDRVRKLNRKADKYAVKAAKYNKKVAKYDKRLSVLAKEVADIQRSQIPKSTAKRGHNYTAQFLTTQMANQQMQQAAHQATMQSMQFGQQMNLMNMSLGASGGTNPHMF